MPRDFLRPFKNCQIFGTLIVLLHLHSDAVPAAAQQQVCIDESSIINDDAPIYTVQTYQLKWKHTQLGNLMSTGG